MRFLNWKILVPVLLVAVLIGAAYAERKTLLVNAIGMYMQWNRHVEPNRAVAWAAPENETAAARPAGERPNIVLIVADDLGFNDLSFFGGGVAGGSVPTPHIDSIAREGMNLSNGYAGNAVCAPSRAMIMTGRYSTRFGFEFTPVPDGMQQVIRVLSSGDDRLHPVIVDADVPEADIPFAQRGMPASETTIAEVLQEAGYQTLHIGKWHLGRTEGFRPRDQGFDESLMMEGGLYLPENSPDVVNSKQSFDFIDQALWQVLNYSVSFNDSAPFEPDGYLTDYFTEEAVSAIKANRDRPFFLYLAHWGVHTPLQAAKADYDALSHIEDHRLRVYAAMVRSLDRSVGQVLQTLKEEGLEENTLVIFTSDNGGADYVGLPEINQPYRGWKLTMFEGGTHVPFFAKWPGRIAPGSRLESPVSHLDILPTSASVAGLSGWEVKPIDGVDLLPYLTGEKESFERPIFWREGYYQAVLHQGWKMHVSDNPDKVWLFNLREDPTEQNNLAEAKPEKVAELKEMLAAFNAEQADPSWPSVSELPVLIDKTGAEKAEPGDEYIYWPN